MIELTDAERERDLLKWLGTEEFSQYGECHGKTLDALIARGLAQVHESGNQGSFIAKGNGGMYRAVSLTDQGHAALAAERQNVVSYDDNGDLRITRVDR